MGFIYRLILRVVGVRIIQKGENMGIYMSRRAMWLLGGEAGVIKFGDKLGQDLNPKTMCHYCLNTGVVTERQRVPWDELSAVDRAEQLVLGGFVYRLVEMPCPHHHGESMYTYSQSFESNGDQVTISHRTGEKMVPVLYLDLDGTVRLGKDELGRFVNGPEDVKVFDQVPELLQAYKNLGWRIIGVSNQGGIALRYMDMRTCVAAMSETQLQCNSAFDKIIWCSHHPDATDPEMAHCWCRKPRPGMVIEAALDLAHKTGEIYPPHLALFVGDRPEDEGCAENAGIRFMPAELWRTGTHVEELMAQG